MGERRKLSTLERTAYHEAGHAVAAYRLRRRVTRVSIVPDPEAGSLGHCGGQRWRSTFRPDVGVTPSVRDQLERAIMVSLAGAEAEAEAVGRRNNVGAGSDYDHASYLALFAVEGDADQVRPYLEWLRLRARGVIRHPTYWHAIERLAATLLDQPTMGERVVRQTIAAEMRGWMNEQLEGRPSVKVRITDAHGNEREEIITLGTL